MAPSCDRFMNIRHAVGVPNSPCHASPSDASRCVPAKRRLETRVDCRMLNSQSDADFLVSCIPVFVPEDHQRDLRTLPPSSSQRN
jgi:hypothetical protein